MTKKRVAVLISGRGSNMVALIEAAQGKDYPAEIALVLSNQPDAAGLTRARDAGIVAAVVDHRQFSDDREAFERSLDEELRKYRIELICLAGFMRLLTSWFIRRWRGRILNIHPALLPQFKGLHTHRRALDAGVKQHGATVHFVVEETDAGPVILQQSVPVSESDTEETLAARVLAIEHRIYPEALRLVAEGHVKFAGACDEACAR